MTRIHSGICMVEIPKKLEKSKPKLYKIMGMEAYYKKYGHFYGNIIINKHCKLLDGYVIYYTAKKLDVQDVPILMVNTRDRIKHFLRRLFRKVGK